MRHIETALAFEAPKYVKKVETYAEGDAVASERGIAVSLDTDHAKAYMAFGTQSYYKEIEIVVEYGRVTITVNESPNYALDDSFNIKVKIEFDALSFGGMLAITRWEDRLGLNSCTAQASTRRLALEKAITFDERNYFVPPEKD